MRTSKAMLMVVGCFALGFFAISALAQEKEEKVSLEQTPAAVKAAIQKEAGAGKIIEIEREMKGGKEVYEAEILIDGQKYEIKIAADGTVLGKKKDTEEEDEEEEEDTLTIDQIPETARAALLKLAGGAKIVKAGSDKEHGVIVYEAEWERDGVQHDAAVTAEGALVETEETLSADKAPAAVLAMIAKYFANDAKVVVKKKMIVVYEIEAVVDGKEKEIAVFPTGRMHGEKEMKHGEKGKKHEEEEDDEEGEEHDDD